MSPIRKSLKSIVVLPFVLGVLAGCQSGNSGTTTSASAPAISNMAATGGTAAGAAGAAAGAAGAAAASGFTVPDFPAGVATSDGFQANPANDATFATLINGVRTAAGAPVLAYNAQLDQAAQVHANDMLANGFLGHTGSDNSSVGDRATAAGYNWTAIGENVAQGQQNENAALVAWQNSAGHRANNENPIFEDFGLARAGSGADIRWALVLGRQ